MASDALDKYETRTFTARHKIAIMICFFISAAILFAVFLFYQGQKSSLGGQKRHFHGDGHNHDDHDPDEEEWWMDDEDFEDDWDDY